MSKRKQFCDTSSCFELDNIQNEAILRDLFNSWTWQPQKQRNSVRPPSKIESWVQHWQPRTNAMCFAFFSLHLSKVLRLPRKVDARSYKVLYLSRKIILANLQIWCSKMQAVSGNQRPDLLTSLMNMSFVLRLPRDMHFCRSSSNVPSLPSFLEIPQKLHVLLTFEKVHDPLRLPCETTSERPKVVRTLVTGVFSFFTCRRASRHNGVHFFDISTSKSGPDLVCFAHFDFDMCFAPKQRAFFSTSQLPKMGRTWFVLYILTSQCASCHTGVQFFISHLARWLRTRRFSEPTFRPPGATNHWKNTSLSRLSYLFAYLHLLCSDSFSSLIFSLLLFCSLWLFPSLLFMCPYCQKFDF